MENKKICPVCDKRNPKYCPHGDYRSEVDRMADEAGILECGCKKGEMHICVPL